MYLCTMNSPPKSTTNSTYFIRGTASSFSGKERDEETGFGYFGARYYDAELMVDKKPPTTTPIPL